MTNSLQPGVPSVKWILDPKRADYPDIEAGVKVELDWTVESQQGIDNRKRSKYRLV
jgi:hypothetical protein